MELAEPSCQVTSNANSVKQIKTEQILICPYIFRCDDLPHLSGSSPGSLRETGLARVHLGLSVPQGNLFSLCASFVILRELGQLFKSGNVRGIKRLP